MPQVQVRTLPVLGGDDDNATSILYARISRVRGDSGVSTGTHFMLSYELGACCCCQVSNTILSSTPSAALAHCLITAFLLSHLLEHSEVMEQCFALAVGVLSLVGLANGQQFTDATLSHNTYSELREQCYEALNTTVQDCPGFLADKLGVD